MKRAINKRVLILCEGQTEEFYAKRLRNELPREKQRYIHVEVAKAKFTDPKSLVFEARRKVKQAQREKNAYDDVWLFFDNDNTDHLKLVFDLIKNSDLKIAYSAICIEHWFILHYENCGKAFSNGAQALNHLKKHWLQYEKARVDAYSILKDKLSTAIKNAKSINKRYDTDAIEDRNPYFTVPDLIDYFEKL